MTRRLLTLVGWFAGLGVAAAVLVTSTGPLLARLGAAGAAPDTAVAAAAAAAAWLVVGWLSLGLALTLADVVLGAATTVRSDALEWLASTVAPSSIRLAVHRSLRVGLVAGAVGTTLVTPAEAFAGPAAPTADVRPTDRLVPHTWPVLDRPASPVDTPAARPTGTDDLLGSHEAMTTSYRVRAGDSLWSIAADHLPAGASPADVARAWPRWWRVNRDVVGADPGLIRPGQLLRIPGAAS